MYLHTYIPFLPIHLIWTLIQAEGPHAWPRDAKWWEARGMAGNHTQQPPSLVRLHRFFVGWWVIGGGNEFFFLKPNMMVQNLKVTSGIGHTLGSANQQDAFPNALIQIMLYLLAVIAKLSITNAAFLDRKCTPASHVIYTKDFGLGVWWLTKLQGKP